MPLQAGHSLARASRPLKPASRRAAFGTQVQIVRFRTLSVNNSVASPEHSLAEEARSEREALFTAMSLIMAHLGRDKRIANERQFAEAICVRPFGSAIPTLGGTNSRPLSNGFAVEA